MVVTGTACAVEVQFSSPLALSVHVTRHGIQHFTTRDAKFVGHGVVAQRRRGGVMSTTPAVPTAHFSCKRLLFVKEPPRFTSFYFFNLGANVRTNSLMFLVL